ncbi:hypothetical protein ACFXTO_038020 [Malus domestica]
MLPAVEAHVPLLQDRKPVRRRFVSVGVFNVSTSIIGAGIMSIPATLKVLGVIPTFVLIVIIALLADVSVEFLMRFTHSGESTTYSGIMRESFGQIIIGDVLSGNGAVGVRHSSVLQEWFGVHWWNSREIALLFTFIFIFLPLVLLRVSDVHSAMAIYAIFEGKVNTPRLLPSSGKQTSFFDFFTVVPVLVTAFTFHFNVHPIGFELGKSSDMISVVKISLVLCAAIYFSIGLFGYLLFGDAIMVDILVNFDRSSDSAMGAVLNDAVRLSYALYLMLVFPLLNFSLRVNLDELCINISAQGLVQFWGLKRCKLECLTKCKG